MALLSLKKCFLGIFVIISILSLAGCGYIEKDDNGTHSEATVTTMSEPEQLKFIDENFHLRLFNLLKEYQNDYTSIVESSKTYEQAFSEIKTLTKNEYIPRLQRITTAIEKKRTLTPAASGIESLAKSELDAANEFFVDVLKIGESYQKDKRWYKKLPLLKINKALSNESKDGLKFLMENYFYDNMSDIKLEYEHFYSLANSGKGTYNLNINGFNQIKQGMSEEDVIATFQMPYTYCDTDSKDIMILYWVEDKHKIYNPDEETYYDKPPASNEKFVKITFTWIPDKDDPEYGDYYVSNKEIFNF